MSIAMCDVSLESVRLQRHQSPIVCEMPPTNLDAVQQEHFLSLVEHHWVNQDNLEEAERERTNIAGDMTMEQHGAYGWRSACRSK